jgi:hypothetical protein
LCLSPPWQEERRERLDPDVDVEEDEQARI